MRLVTLADDGFSSCQEARRGIRLRACAFKWRYIAPGVRFLA